MNKWPLQKDCDAFYGNPRGRNGQASIKWEADNLVRISAPWQMTYAGRPIKNFRIHKKCAESLLTVFEKIWIESGEMQKVCDDWGVAIFGGSYNYRLIRGGNHLSMHSYGCAIDLDPVRNAMHDRTPHFAGCEAVLDAFKSEGAEWGGPWLRPDAMHWQFARTH